MGRMMKTSRQVANAKKSGKQVSHLTDNEKGMDVWLLVRHWNKYFSTIFAAENNKINSS